MNFHPGQEVVCVDANARDDGPPPAGLIENANYHITKVIDGGEIGIGLQLQELPIGPPFAGYFASRFRSLDPRKTDISVFKKLLVDARLIDS
jgi:hypothetical protein